MEKSRFRNLRDARYHAGDLSQKEVALMVGISCSMYSQLERGEIGGSINTWKRIQEVFSLTDAEVWQFQKQFDK